jgi:hypothetical protein
MEYGGRLASRFALLTSMLAVLFASGCSKPNLNPEQIRKVCFTSGELSALTWIAIEQPKPDEVKAVSVVLDLIQQNCTAWVVGGFIANLPGIDAGINKAIPGTDERSIALRKIAHIFALEMLTQLDLLFTQHPDWTTKGDQVAEYVKAFCEGGKEGLKDFMAGTERKILRTIQVPLSTPTRK